MFWNENHQTFWKNWQKQTKIKKKHQNLSFLRFKSNQAYPKRHNDNCCQVLTIAHQYNFRGYVFGYENIKICWFFVILNDFLIKRYGKIRFRYDHIFVFLVLSCHYYWHGMVRYGDLGLDTLISYRIQAYKKAAFILSRCGIEHWRFSI